jgi:hypothetical protein
MIIVHAMTITEIMNWTKTSISLRQKFPLPPKDPDRAARGLIEERYNAGYSPERRPTKRLIPSMYKIRTG